MHTKNEIEQKLIEAENAIETAGNEEQNRLAAVITALRWVLEKKIILDANDPVTEKL